MVWAGVLQTLHFGCGGRPVIDDVRVVLTGAGLETESNDQDLWMVLGEVTRGGAPSRG